MHEFTTPGTYCARNVDTSLHTYAVPTKMVNGEAPWDAPYCRFVFLVEAQDEPIKVKSFGSDVQVIHRGKDLRVLELHAYRGWHIYDTSEYVMRLSADDCLAIQNASEVPRPLLTYVTCNSDARDELDDLCSVMAQDTHTTFALSSPSDSISRVDTDATFNIEANAQANISRNVIEEDALQVAKSSSLDQSMGRVDTDAACSVQANVEGDVRAVEWVPGQPWHWGVYLRCHFCQTVRPIKEFGKKSQAYGCQQRRCRNC